MPRTFRLTISGRKRRQRAGFLLVVWMGFLLTATIFPCDEVFASAVPGHSSVIAASPDHGSTVHEAVGHPAQAGQHCNDGIDLGKDVPKTVCGGLGASTAFLSSLVVVIPSVAFPGILSVSGPSLTPHQANSPLFTAQAAQHLYLLTSLRLRD